MGGFSREHEKRELGVHTGPAEVDDPDAGLCSAFLRLTARTLSLMGMVIPKPSLKNGKRQQEDFLKHLLAKDKKKIKKRGIQNNRGVAKDRGEGCRFCYRPIIYNKLLDRKST